ncbi:hypothetical protein BIU82_06415 [Arthrobacter sp. SW1]|uniref:hypothetical protein n=1 Tax=Arthrobacter sp. SW1 TaxID=1920889 RepID=UPI000877BDC1|nr:hypothetical protein [Arthrobacter sp. SW1]OFI38127.1 hypothetical protein BIU82_06415 [Arthrobacter sp. SW1]
MQAFLTAVMLACCGIGMLCPLLERKPGQWVPMAVMLAAMADTTLGPGILPGVVWGLLLLLAVPLPLLSSRRERRSGMELHRAFSVLGMFALLVTGLHAAGLDTAQPSHAHPAAGGFAPLLASALAIAVAGYSLAIAARMLRHGKAAGRALHPLEALSSAGALGAMLFMAAA